MADGGKQQVAPHPLTRMRGVNASLIGKLVRVKVRSSAFRLCDVAKGSGMCSMQLPLAATGVDVSMQRHSSPRCKPDHLVITQA